MNASQHVVITDSGLGGISVCAEIEHGLRKVGSGVKLTYFNALPEEGRGYNELPDMASRATVFDRALQCMALLNPDQILIACNTLSILYPLTVFSRSTAIPVSGIIDAGVDLIAEALSNDPASAAVLFGTRTTVESAVHLGRLLERGIDPARIAAVSCHGLAGAIESDPDGTVTETLIGKAAAEGSSYRLPGKRIYAGLCCTHYTFIREKLGAALQKTTGKPVVTLDPNGRLAQTFLSSDYLINKGSSESVVKVISQAILNEQKRRIMAGRISVISDATGRALLNYTHAPDLF